MENQLNKLPSEVLRHLLIQIGEVLTDRHEMLGCIVAVALAAEGVDELEDLHTLIHQYEEEGDIISRHSAQMQAEREAAERASKGNRHSPGQIFNN